MNFYHSDVLWDTFDIAKRLKQINPNYIIKRNHKKKRFEIFFKTSKIQVLELVLPFSELDERTLNFVQKTRIENNKKLLEEMEKENEKKLLQNQNKALDMASDKANEVSKYLFNNTTKTKNFANVFNSRWI